LTLDADEARGRFQKVYARFAADPPAIDLAGAVRHSRRRREIEAIVQAGTGGSSDLIGRVRAASPETFSVEALTLEEIFVACLARQENAA
jgi:hypothetical protein